MYISSEGQAGRIAKNGIELFQILISRPDWRDLLKFSAGGDLDEMRRSADILWPSLQPDQPELTQRQATLLSVFETKALEDPVETLHAAVSGGAECSVVAADGTVFESLFNTFTATNFAVAVGPTPR